jgi:hypothetical protein
VALIPLFLAGVTGAAVAFFRFANYGTEPDFLPLWVGGIPGWVRLIETLICMAMVAIPCSAAVWYGRSAVLAGDPRGRTPMLIASIAWLGYAALTLNSLVS